MRTVEEINDLIADWALNKFGLKVNSIEFEAWTDCYSSWTHDYGVDCTFLLEDGTRKRMQWSLPDIITGLQEYELELQKAQDICYISHR